jgi:hypothetical protein
MRARQQKQGRRERENSARRRETQSFHSIEPTDWTG